MTTDKMTIAKILSISYCLDKTITMELSNHTHLVHVRAENIVGGWGVKDDKERYIDRLVVGGKIAYESIGIMNVLPVCWILSDGITEVDPNGNLLRW